MLNNSSNNKITLHTYFRYLPFILIILLYIVAIGTLITIYILYYNDDMYNSNRLTISRASSPPGSTAYSIFVIGCSISNMLLVFIILFRFIYILLSSDNLLCVEGNIYGSIESGAADRDQMVISAQTRLRLISYCQLLFLLFFSIGFYGVVAFSTYTEETTSTNDETSTTHMVFLIITLISLLGLLTSNFFVDRVFYVFYKDNSQNNEDFKPFYRLVIVRGVLNLLFDICTIIAIVISIYLQVDSGTNNTTNVFLAVVEWILIALLGLWIGTFIYDFLKFQHVSQCSTFFI